MNTVTGQCDHILGLSYARYSELGETNDLTRKSEHRNIDEYFAYCPSCGLNLSVSGKFMATDSEL
jgi:hypothetical protein